MRIGPIVVQFGDREQRLQQFVDAGAYGGAGLDHFRVAAPFGRQQIVGGQLLVNPLDVDARQIDLVERHDDRHAGGAGMADGLFGLRHDAVVGRHHQHRDIGDVGSAGPHFGECLVAGRVDEGLILRPSFSI